VCVYGRWGLKAAERGGKERQETGGYRRGAQLAVLLPNCGERRAYEPLPTTVRLLQRKLSSVQSLDGKAKNIADRVLLV